MKKQKKRIFSGGIGKLSKEDIYAFSLPAITTCPSAGVCRRKCYGNTKRYLMKIVKARLKENLNMSKSKGFVENCINEISSFSYSVIRWNATGDVYDQEYLDKINDIGRKTPRTFHYLYTKSLQLDWNSFDNRTNTKRINSYGGKLDYLIDKKKPHAIIFEDTIPSGYTDCSISDRLAIKSTKIGLRLRK